MAVPLLDLKQQNLALHGELTSAFDRVLRSGQYILGAELEAFERAVAPLGGAPFALGISSGTDALLLALMALGIGPGDEVIVPSFTFFATGGCVSRVGATPVFADVCPICFNLDVQDAERRLSSRTKAVIPVHLFGQSADMDSILGLARKHALAVIEDGAQALGAEYRGKRVGAFGDFATYSFFPSKNLGALGDAGLLVTRDETLAEKARLLRVHGAKPKYYHHLIGANFRMDPLQAAMLSVKLPRYENYTRCRQANAADYTARLRALEGVVVTDAGQCGCRGGTGGETPARLVLPVAYPHVTHIWNQYTLRVPGKGRRDALREHLSSKGIGSEIYYPVPLHAQPCFAAGRIDRGPWPVSDQMATEVVSIPIFPELTGAQREEVVSAIAEFLASGR